MRVFTVLDYSSTEKLIHTEAFILVRTKIANTGDVR